MVADGAVLKVNERLELEPSWETEGQSPKQLPHVVPAMLGRVLAVQPGGRHPRLHRPAERLGNLLHGGILERTPTSAIREHNRSIALRIRTDAPTDGTRPLPSNNLCAAPSCTSALPPLSETPLAG